MRVVAGSARGRRLVAPAGDDVRPTSDRVRESVFNALGSLDAVGDVAVVDLFAGTGALGIEALSRGAAHVTFVDAARASVESVRANLAVTDLAERANVVQRDAFDVLRTGPDALGGPVGLVLADPPYAFDRWEELLAAIEPVLTTGAVVVAESDRSLDGTPDRGGWSILRERRYGGTVVTMLTFDRAPTFDQDRDGS